MAGIDLDEAKGPDGVRIYAIGDVHGRLDLLRGLHAAIEGEIARDGVRDWRIVQLGDYVDRGPDSRGVLDFLSARQAADPRVVVLAGNHDLGFLDFLDEPDPDGLFANWGGDATARSYGVEANFRDVIRLDQTRAALERAVPRAHRRFLEGLPFSVEFGDFFFCHAGIRPGVALDRQAVQDLIWMREPFLGHRGLHPKVIVHGHTAEDEPELLPNRVNVDTRAYQSGRLTALAIDGPTKRILSFEDAAFSGWR